MNFTDEQNLAIHTDNCNLLVAARSWLSEKLQF